MVGRRLFKELTTKKMKNLKIRSESEDGNISLSNKEHILITNWTILGEKDTEKNLKHIHNFKKKRENCNKLIQKEPFEKSWYENSTPREGEKSFSKVYISLNTEFHVF